MSEIRGQAGNPYVGLRPFETDDSLFFFGRDRQVQDLLPRLEKAHFLAVVGGSGCGKSSLIRAGLIPALQAGFLVEDRDAWLIATMRPGDRARRRLAEAILRLDEIAPSRGDLEALDQRIQDEGVDALVARLKPLLERRRANLLLLVDQFEELFHTDRRDGVVRPSEESRDFVALMLDLAAAPGLSAYVVLTMRSDFLGDCALFEGLPERMNLSQYLVPRLGFGERREAIVGPAELCGARVSPMLVDRLLSEQLDTQDDLPVLQHCLRRTWAEWRRRGGQGELSVENYEAIGTVQKALNADAEEALRGLSTGEIDAAKRLFQALTVTDASNRRVRRPTRLSTLVSVTGASEAALRAITARFTGPDRSFLSVPSEEDPLIDISHESLIRQWRRLQEWADQEAGSAAIYRRLVDVTTRHQAGEADLYPPADLAVATRWRDEQRPDEAWARRYESSTSTGRSRLGDGLAFIEASARAQRQRRATWIASVIVAFSLLAVLAVYALKAKSAADAAKGTAELNAVALSNSLARERGISAVNSNYAITQMQLAESLSNANEGLKQATTNLEARNQSLVLLQVDLTNTVAKLQVATTNAETAKNLADTNAQAARAAKWETTKALFESYLHGATLLSQNGSYAAALAALGASRDLESNSLSGTMGGGRISTRNLVEWFVRRMERSAVLTNTDAGVALRDIAISRDGRWVVVGGEHGRAAMFDRHGQNPVRSWQAHPELVRSVVVEAGGRWCATAGDHQIVRWLIPQGTMLDERRASGVVEAMSLSPDGRWIAVAGRDGFVTIWPTEQPQAPQTLAMEIPHLSCLAFSPDSRRLATGAASGMIQIWEMSDGRDDWGKARPPRVLAAFEGVIRQIGYNPSGTLLATGCEDGTIQVWNVDRRLLARTLRGHQSRVDGLAFGQSSGRNVLVSAGADLVVRVWDLESAGLIAILEGHTAGVTGVALSDDTCFSASNDESWREWRLSALGESLLAVDALATPTACVLSPDASFVAIGSEGGEIRMVSLPGRVTLWSKPDAHDTNVSRLAVSPDGRLLASVGFDGRIRLWDVASGRLERELERRAGPVHGVAFSPDGLSVATAGASRLEISASPPAVSTPASTGEVCVFDLATGRVRTCRAHELDALSVAFDDEGDRLLSVGADGRAHWWEVARFPAESREVGSGTNRELAWGSFRPGTRGGTVALVGRDGVLRVVRLDGSEPELRLTGHENSIIWTAFGSDGAQAFTADAKGTLRVWDIDKARPLFALALPVGRNRGGSVTDFSFVPRTPSGEAWAAVPLSSGVVEIVRFGAIYH